jgi:BirA family biotin operon repressor/biotin-[acetyl-CoA-carboxylase] ligase
LAESNHPHGTWVSARIQEAGRGRLGRKWASLEGNLFLSYVARIEPKANWSWIPLSVAVAIVRCLSEMFPEVKFKIKWPNDIWVSHQGIEAKMGGILCEGTSSSRSYVVVGLGLNCSHSPDYQEVGQTTMDLTACAESGLVTADDVRLAIVESLNFIFDRLMEEGKDWVKKEYEKWRFFEPAAHVVWNSALGECEGTVVGLGEAGELLVRLPTDEIRGLFSEEVKIRRSV